jgi:hypothetical protein
MTQNNMILILMTQKDVALYYYVKVVIKDITINMSERKFSKAFRISLSN